MNIPKSKFSNLRKLDQYTCELLDQKYLRDCYLIDASRKNSLIVKRPMAISKGLVVGMKFQKINRMEAVHSLNNMITKLACLEYRKKIAKG